VNLRTEGPGGELQVEEASKPSRHLVDQVLGQGPSQLLEVALVQRDDGGHLTTESFGKPVAMAGRKTLPGRGASDVLDVTTAATRR